MLPLDYGVDGTILSNNSDLPSAGALFPFDGLNVEDLWNWMIVTDAIEPTDEADWVGAGLLQEGSQALQYT